MPIGKFTLLTTLAWRNLWRHTRRTAVMIFALALGVWAMIAMAAFIRGWMGEYIHKEIMNLTGHVQIHATDYRDDPSVVHRLPLTTGLLEKTLSEKPVTAWDARVRVPGVIASERESAGVEIVGIDPAAERGLSFIDGAIVEGRDLESPDDPSAVIGRELAERLETQVGRRVVLTSQDANNEIADRGFRVVGIFRAEPEAVETGYVFIGRRIAQQMLKIGDDVSEIAVMTRDRERLDALVARLRAAAPGRDVAPWTEIRPILVLTQKVNNVVLLIWFAVVFAAMSFGLINTLLMAIFERTREFGLFQALGMPPRYILQQVLIESLILLMIGLAVGNLAAWATVVGLRDGVDLSRFAEGLALVGMSPVIYPKLDESDIVASNVIVIVLGVLASLYPAWRAARRVPVEAITRV
ncbi:MAG TPA: ABC transporter permease [Burkholderiales bacterium]